MKDNVQEHYEKELLRKDSESLRYFNKGIRKANNELLREYYCEFAKDDDNNEHVLGAYKFLQ
jgi:hypothetical protein